MGQTDLERALQRIALLDERLSIARRHPIKMLGRLILYKAIRAVQKLGVPLPSRSIKRLTELRAVLDPDREKNLPPVARHVSLEELRWVLDAMDPVYIRSQLPATMSTLSDKDLAIHYLLDGWRDGIDPTQEFSTAFYIEANPDVVDSGSNPFVHYLRFGRAEGRRPRGDEPISLDYQPDAVLARPHLRSVYDSIDFAVQGKPSAVKGKRALPRPGLLIHWVMPDFVPGSGGHMTIFRIVRELEALGHKCFIWLETPTEHETGDTAWDTIIKHFQCISAQVRFVHQGFRDMEGDVAIATSWSSAYVVNSAVKVRERFYFVQDYESEFYPSGSERFLAEASYDLALPCICAGPWLERLLTNKYGRWVRSFPLAYDPDEYKLPKETVAANNRIRIVAYARDLTPRRCVDLLMLGLSALGKRRHDFEVHFFGQNNLPFTKTNFYAFNHGVMSPNELVKFYHEADIGLCFSATNYSLIPQEMMASGLPVVELASESCQLTFPPASIALAPPSPQGVAETIERLIDEPDLRKNQATEALQWVKQFSWPKSAKQVENAIYERLAENHAIQEAPHILLRHEATVDVVIPTYNGIATIKSVIAALKQQQDANRLRIYCIDSGSTDGTVEWLREQHDIVLTEIPPAEFQHGRTRNIAASQGDAEFIAFITQDAEPVGNFWARDIVFTFNHCLEAAGLFGTHIPYRDHPLAVQNEVSSRFERLLDHPLILSKDTDINLWESGDINWRQILYFFSNNNSAIRRNIWKENPLPEVEFGEDQLWSKNIIELGYRKAYAPTVRVFHSHNYSPEQAYNRAMIEARYWLHNFGFSLGASTKGELSEFIKREQQDFYSWAKRQGLSNLEIDEWMRVIDSRQRGWFFGSAS